MVSIISRAAILAWAMTLALGDVSHVLQDGAEEDTPPPPPRPYLFSYAAGRFPGQYDRKHAEVSDGRGFVKGSYSVLDPRNHIHTVDYTADKDGFHPVVNDALPEHPSDTKAVALAKQKFFYLYNKIAQEQQLHPHPDDTPSFPRDTEAVAREKHIQAVLYEKIAREHARIAAEREAQRIAFEATSEHPQVEEEGSRRNYDYQQ